MPVALASSRPLGSRWGDVGLAAVTVSVSGIGIVQAGGPHRGIVALLLVLAVAPWIVALMPGLEVPLGAHVAITLTSLGVLHGGGPRWGWLDLSVDSQLSLLIGVVLVGEVCAVGSRGVVVTTSLGASAVLGARYLTDEHWARSVAWPLAFLLGIGVGVLVRALFRSLAQLQEAQSRLEVAAIQAERKRIAREVHDLVAHSLTVTMLHMSAARMAIGRGDYTDALDALDEADSAGRSSIREIRRTVGLLRDDDESQTMDDRAPDAFDLERLVDSWTAAGMKVQFHVSGDVGALDPATGLVTFRVVQESLANAAKHLPGASNDVVVSVGAGELRVTVTSRGVVDTAERHDGHGIVGMRERVNSVNGSFCAGRTADGWRVAAVIPLQDSALMPSTS